MSDSIQRIVLVNGPPGSGKDAFGRMLAEEALGKTMITKFAKRVKEMTHALYGLIVDGRPLPHHYFENCKNDPHEMFRGISPRQAYINTSELLMKPVHGEDIFGRMLAEDLGPIKVPLVIITDSGFVPEAEAIKAVYGADKLRLVRMRRLGHDFKGDSRGYVDIEGVESCWIDNNLTLRKLRHKVRDYARKTGIEIDEHGTTKEEDGQEGTCEGSQAQEA